MSKKKDKASKGKPREEHAAQPTPAPEKKAKKTKPVAIEAEAATESKTKRPAASDTTIRISRAIADPSRFAVLRHIAGTQNSSCSDLRECLGMNAATLSHHIKQLESAGLIETRRDGKFVRADLKKKAWKNYLGDLKSLAL